MNDFSIESLKASFKNGSSLMKLIYVNAAVFLISGLIYLPFFLGGRLGNPVEPWLSLPADLGEFIFKPWTLITYMFSHIGLSHIFWNMLMLYFSGQIFQLYLGEQKLVPVYIYGGLAGAFLFLLFYNVFPVYQHMLGGAQLIGASAGVFAVLIAIAAHVPNLSINLLLLGPVKLKFIALVLIGIDLISITSSNSGGHIAHLGGAIFGFWFATQIKKGKDPAKGLSNLFNGLWSFKRKSKIRVEHRRSKSDAQYNVEKKANQQEIDRILDKISKSGYDSLSAEEKRLLFNAGNK